MEKLSEAYPPERSTALEYLTSASSISFLWIFPSADSSTRIAWADWMIRSRIALALIGIALVATATPVSAAPFTIRPLPFVAAPDLSITAAGTITTAGNTSNITGWDVTVTTVERVAHYTPANTANLSMGPFSSDGTYLTVSTSPDGFLDGGLLYFRSPNVFMDFGVAVADFSGANIVGGQALYMAGAAFDFLPLNRPDGFEHVAAISAGGNVFQLVSLTFPGGATVQGTITTDGATGALAAGNIISWDITVDQVTLDIFNAATSTLMANLVDLTPGGTALTVLNPDGFLTFSKGSVGGHPYSLTLADFSTQAPVGGQAGYYLGSLAFYTLDLNADAGPWPVTELPIAVRPTTWSGIKLQYAPLSR